MKDRYLRDLVFSLATFFLLIISVNIFLFPESPGFLGLNPHPYLIAVLLMAGRFGRWEGLMSALIAVLILTCYTFMESRPYFDWKLLTETAFVTSSISFFLAALIVGEMRGFNKSFERAIVSENGELKEEVGKLKEQLEIVTLIKEELETRIVGQEETVHSLYQATKSLETLDEKRFYEALTKLTIRFTGATKVTLYVVDYPNDRIRCVARHGHGESTIDRKGFPLDHDIFDVVLNSNQLVTIKDISDSESIFKVWDKSQHKAYVYVPISMASVIVGVLTIDDIPFLKLNISTIRILALIAELAVPALKNIIKYQDLQEMVKIDPITEIMKNESFITAAGVEFKKSARYDLDYSILVIAVAGLLDVESAFGHKARIDSLKWLSKKFQSVMRNVDLIGIGEKPGEFILALPFTGTEGVLSVIDRIKKLYNEEASGKTWRSKLSFNFGAASYHPTLSSSSEMLKLAYHSLELNKEGESGRGSEQFEKEFLVDELGPLS